MDITVDELVEYEVVIFLAGLSNDPMAEFRSDINFIENTAAPTNLAFLTQKAADKSQTVKRFIYAGTCSVYGYTANDLKDETCEVSPKYPYGISKLLGEKAVLSFESDNFRPIVLRKGTVGGWSNRMRYDLVVNAMTKSALCDGVINVYNPTVWRPLVDIRDVSTVYLRAIESNLEITGVYNVGYDNYTIGRLADEIKEELTLAGFKVKVNVDHKEDMRNYKITNNKAKIELDFTAQYSPRDSVVEIMKNVLDIRGNFSVNNMNDENFYNIKIFKKGNIKWQY